MFVPAFAFDAFEASAEVAARGIGVDSRERERDSRPKRNALVSPVANL